MGPESAIPVSLSNALAAIIRGEKRLICEEITQATGLVHRHDRVADRNKDYAQNIGCYTAKGSTRKKPSLGSKDENLTVMN